MRWCCLISCWSPFKVPGESHLEFRLRHHLLISIERIVFQRLHAIIPYYTRHAKPVVGVKHDLTYETKAKAAWNLVTWRCKGMAKKVERVPNEYGFCGTNIGCSSNTYCMLLWNHLYNKADTVMQSMMIYTIFYMLHTVIHTLFAAGWPIPLNLSNAWCQPCLAGLTGSKLRGRAAWPDLSCVITSIPEKEPCAGVVLNENPGQEAGRLVDLWWCLTFTTSFLHP